MSNPVEKCLIFGAGSSLNYGFPLGSGLLEEIIKYTKDVPTHFADDYILKYETSDIKIFHAIISEYGNDIISEFREKLINSSTLSIDDFLSNTGYNRFYKLGKQIIVLFFLLKENKELLKDFTDNKRDARTDHWHRILFQYLRRNRMQFESSKIKILTFNYERSFEYALKNHFKEWYLDSVYSKTEIESLIEKNVIHIYGNIGDIDEDEIPLPTDPKHSFSEDQLQENLNLLKSKLIQGRIMYESKKILVSLFNLRKRFPLAKECLDLILNEVSEKITINYDSRPDTKHVSLAKELISNSSELYFLGFGFDSFNCINTLNLPDVLNSGQKAYATVVGFSSEKVAKLKQVYFNKARLVYHEAAECSRLFNDLFW